MTLDETIKNYEKTAEEKEKQAIWVWSKEDNSYYENCIKVVKELRQLAGWLKELKKYRKSHWKSVNEGLPKKCGCYLITTKIRIHDLKPYYEVCTAKFNGKYFDIGYVGDDISVIAWMPLPEPYKAESQDKE